MFVTAGEGCASIDAIGRWDGQVAESLRLSATVCNITRPNPWTRFADTPQLWEVRGTDDFERVFAALHEERPEGLYVPGGPLMRAHEQRIVAVALKSGIPSAHDSREAVEGGGLMSYAYAIGDQYRRAAAYVDKILKGAKPADLPVEQPTPFELVINPNMAKTSFTVVGN